MRNEPFDEVRAAAAAGQVIPSVAYKLIRQIQFENAEADMTPEQDTLARNVAGVVYLGAADSVRTTSAIESCAFTMAMFPNVQKKV